MTKPAELSRTIYPRLALLIIAFAGALFGPATRIGASEICMENPLEGMVQPPRDESPCGSLGATLLAVGAVFFEDCSPNNPEVSRKYSEIASRYAGMLPSVGLPAMAAELSAEAGKDGGRCAMRAVVREGLPFSDETREELETVLDAAFELQDISDLIKDIRATTQPQIALEKRDELKNKFQKELTERYDGTRQLSEGASAVRSLITKLYSSVVGYQSLTRLALDASETGLARCAIGETEARLAEAVKAGRQGLDDARQGIRGAERDAECWEIRLRQQYGDGWSLRTSLIAGPTLNEYRYALDSRARFERTEAALVEALHEAGRSCRRLKQQVEVRQRMLNQYEAAKARAAAALEAGPCDLSTAEEVLATLRKLEGSSCGDRLGMQASGEVEARITARKAERRMTAACGEEGSGGGIESFTGAWQCPQRGTITLVASGETVTGSVTGAPGEHWGRNQREGGRITGTISGRTLQLLMESGDGTTSRLTGTLTIDGRSFSGPWEWFRGESRLAGGTWTCQRPAGFVPPARRAARLEAVPPAAPGPARLSFNGQVFDVLYERGADTRGVPIDLYYYRTPIPPGGPEPQGEQQWSRFVRVPAAGTPGAEPVVWGHARWDYGPKGWVSASDQGIPPPQAVP